MTRHFRGIAVAVFAAATACTNAGERLTVPSLPQGTVQVAVFFDRDGTASPSAGDTSFSGVRVALVVPGGQDTVRTATTGSNGIALFDSLPVGAYRVVVDRHALADSVGTIAGDTGTIRVVFQPDSIHITRIVRAGYGEVTLAEARALDPGHKVLIRARVSAPLQAFRDSSAFLYDATGFLRVTGARPKPGSAGNAVGDSVFVLGTTGQRDGQGVLEDGIFTTVVVGLAPLPRITTLVDAISAAGGTIDAALIQLNNIVITDTIPSGADFVVKVADPADTTVTLTVVLDQLLGAPHGIFAPGRTGTLRGVLVPIPGGNTWALRPRSGLDIVLN